MLQRWFVWRVAWAGGHVRSGLLSQSVVWSGTGLATVSLVGSRTVFVSFMVRRD